MASSYFDGDDEPVDADKYGTPQNDTSFIGGVAILAGVNYAFTSAQIERNFHGTTDTATIVTTISDNPDFSQTLFATDDTSPIYVELWCGLFKTATQPNNTSTSGMVRRYLGIVDIYSAAFTRDTITFTCRSLGAPLADQKISQIAMQTTIVDFLTQQAEAIGLDVYQNLATNEPVTVQEVLGREFVGGSNLSQAIYSKRILDLVTQGAIFDDAAVWVDDSTIHYETEELIERTELPFVYGEDFMMDDGILAEHSIQFAKDVKVSVKSYTPRIRQTSRASVSGNAFSGSPVTESNTTSVTSQIAGTNASQTFTTNSATGKTTVSVTSFSGGPAKGGTTEADSSSGTQDYVYYFPNLSLAKCQTRAYSIWKQISSMEYRLTIKVAMNQTLLDNLSITSLLLISNMPYVAFNGKYWVRKITETISPEAGWTLDIEAINHAPPAGSA